MRNLDCQNTKATFPVAVVVSRFNQKVTGPLLDGAIERLTELKFAQNQLTVVHVPGAVEIPLAAQRLAQLGIYDAIICLGAVIRGETSHYDYVCEQVSQGTQTVSLQNDMPVVFGVLTTENTEQAMERLGRKKGHKGKEAVDVAVEMVSLLREIG